MAGVAAGGGAAPRRRRALALLLAPALVGCAGGPSGGGGVLVPVGAPANRSDSTTGVAEGRVRNTGSSPRRGAVAVTVYDGEGKVMATLRGDVPSVAPGEETTYRATGGPVGAWGRAEVRVTSEQPG